MAGNEYGSGKTAPANSGARRNGPRPHGVPAPSGLLGKLGRSFAQMADPVFRGVIFKAIFIAIVTLAALLFVFSGLGAWFLQWVLGTEDYSVWAAVGLGIVFLPVMVILTLPVAAIIIGMFLESVADAVEARHYPGDPAARDVGTGEALGVSVRFMVKLLLLNLLFLPLYIFLPGLNIVLFLLLNGYLTGREYFEMVALRHLGANEMRHLRKRNRFKIFMAGVIIAVLLAVPGINFVAPLFGVALMVHVFKEVAAHASA